MGAKIGLERPEQTDRELIQDLLALMASNQVDFTVFSGNWPIWPPALTVTRG